MILSVYLVFLLLALSSLIAIEEVAVNTSFGVVVGLKEDSVIVFRGIPYAEPPVSLLRFQPPRPSKHFYEPYHAFTFSPECWQSELFSEGIRPRMDEDCLYLNIWTPIIDSTTKVKAKYPVMVWIYGGAFLQGGANKPLYYGDKLASKGTIVVTLNYRLGALGFLVSTPDGLFGNYGLADQKLALQWVRDHISSFNGDANRITVFGESAGAMSIGLQYLDQQYHKSLALRPIPPLFHSIILQSNPLGYKYRSVTIANFLGNSYKQLLDCEDVSCLLSESVGVCLYEQAKVSHTPLTCIICM
jgi:para-nitrobenzyl esterase